MKEVNVTVTAKLAGQYICTTQQINTNVTSLYPEILSSSGCTTQSGVLTCMCIVQGFPLPTIKWKLNHIVNSIITTVSNHTINSTFTLKVKGRSNTSVECVSNGKVKMTFNIDKEEEDYLKTIIRIVTELETAVAFLIGILLSSVTCCLMRTCRRKKTRTKENLAETGGLEMVTSDGDLLIDADHVVEGNQAIDQEAAEAGGAVAAGKSDVEYSNLDFSLIKDRQDATRETPGTTETEYAEIKKAMTGQDGEEMADVFKGLNLLETLKESIENNKLSDVRDAVEDLLISRINLAVVGDRVDEKATFINSLRGLGPGDDGAAPSPSPVAPEEVAGYPNPKHPDFRLFSKRHRKKPRRKEEIHLEVLTSQGVAQPKVYVVRPSTLEKFDFPGLLEDMGRDLPEIRANALLLALPTITSTLVVQKKEAFKALVWAAASLSGGVSAIPVPLVASMVDSSVAVRILTKAQLSLCLDNESVERLARQRGMEPTTLKGLRTCVLSVEVTKGEVKKRLAAAEKDLAGASSKLVEMAMPRHARSASRSFTAMLQALNGTIDEMAADAEKILAAALRDGK
ncbi:hypothetical protein D5F01_LYC12982 [Larimichthys crocea]|uniref:IRG-type G domain-containing protein n=1 Tax=Larimichthys crocea TaxID=215358 RepID=A0A6G0ICZ4_LARCR|nr:hypothetical protein D5F01_LYC12982 [Larimichthys crocea]